MAETISFDINGDMFDRICAAYSYPNESESKPDFLKRITVQIWKDQLKAFEGEVAASGARVVSDTDVDQTEVLE